MNEEHSVKKCRLAAIRPLILLCRRLSQRTYVVFKGHPLACLGVGLSLVLGGLSITMLAQRSSAAAAPDQLSAGIAIYQQGEFRLAQAVFAQISPSDPAYGVAQAYDALCRYELCRAARTNDYQWFLNALESPVLASAGLAPELREDLAFKEVDALYQSGQFEGRPGFTKVSAFLQAYPASSHTAAMREYELAAGLDRGMAHVYRASTTDPANFRRSWSNAVEHLELFLSHLRAFPGTEYSILRDRSLAEDLQVALAVLGQEPAALAEIPIRAPDRRERCGLVRVGLHLRLNPTAWEQNLQMLADYQAELQTFPASDRRPRVEYDLARLALPIGEQLCNENAGAVPAEAQIAEAKHAAASRYFEAVRAAQRHAAQAQWAGIQSGERAWLRQVSFATYYYEHDYAGMSAAAEAEMAQSAPGAVEWMRAKVFSGIALYRQAPAQPDAAATALEEVLAFGFRNQREHDLMILEAVVWRMQLALLADDHAKVRTLFDWVNQGPCEAPIKAAFLQDRQGFAVLAGWAAEK
jgi:hypothetical protein